MPLFTNFSTLLIYIGLINLIAFLAFGFDKLKARQQWYRIPEKTLFGLALMGGSFGAVLGMYFFRHKTKKPSFAVGLPLILILQIVLYLYFWQKG